MAVRALYSPPLTMMMIHGDSDLGCDRLVLYYFDELEDLLIGLD